MKITIEIPKAINSKFSDIKLGFKTKKGVEQKVSLFVNFQPLHDFSRDTSSTRFDFFLISAIVYGIDNILNRELYSVDGWAREIEVEFPVNNLNDWIGKEELLQQVLAFLTGDYWEVSFSQLNEKEIYAEKAGRWKKNIPQFDKKNVTKISLFSGGLDSLIGVIDNLEKLGNDEKIIFASHFDSNSSGPNSDQTKLNELLSKEYKNKIYWIQSVITLSRHDSSGAKIKVEDSYRSRSMVFIAIGLYLCVDEVGSNQLIIPENGTISLNYPLTPSRSSSLSTRTTHPFVIEKIQEVITGLKIDVTLTNPYSLLTKGQMVKMCTNYNILLKTFKESVSCGKRGRRQHWDIKIGTDHCGICMPCIYRRAALHKKGLDNQIYGIDILSARSVNDYVDMPALFDYLKRVLPKEKIKRDLLVNGSLNFDLLGDYAEVVINSRKEILKWISDKGNRYIKTELGIK